ncbi:unnamed protein product [Urochloa humidicola]
MSLPCTLLQVGKSYVKVTCGLWRRDLRRWRPWWSTVHVGGYLDGLLAKPWRLGTKQMILIDPQQPTLILVSVSLIS